MKSIKKLVAAMSSAALTLGAATAMSASAEDKTPTKQEIVKAMGAGWNLGNTLDATGKGLGSDEVWGNPKTTQEMIDFVKDQGFTTIRIPITWGRHMDSNYQIDRDWMNRVKEVVDYAYNDGLYVIINIHHDNDIPKKTSDKNAVGNNFFYPSTEYEAQ